METVEKIQVQVCLTKQLKKTWFANQTVPRIDVIQYPELILSSRTESSTEISCRFPVPVPIIVKNCWY